MKVFSKKALVKDLIKEGVSEEDIQNQWLDCYWVNWCVGKTYQECRQHYIVYPEWFEEDIEDQLIKFLEDLKNEKGV